MKFNTAERKIEGVEKMLSVLVINKLWPVLIDYTGFNCLTLTLFLMMDSNVIHRGSQNQRIHKCWKAVWKTSKILSAEIMQLWLSLDEHMIGNQFFMKFMKIPSDDYPIAIKAIKRF